ncbi:hypothetical protein P154DRAFT_602327 [Amniculicola lignicola CBS 123094]|uniref:J domain-containing protein n=1 Tax=Amniculicola lignicola CBS 123094 TaxID=1392246 RepID=A0A6A5WDG7_9PLEO|nr:hypothetical protein P154DRAFT_602327 [Amniculicola lignicola CBS 123094]
MTTPNYYSTLGLVPSACPEVIRATYKSLVLIHHPDKTVHLPSSERAWHAAQFREIQEAYDVLGVPHLKTAYDTELASSDWRVDEERSTFHRSGSVSSARAKAKSQLPKRNASILSSPREKVAISAKIHTQMESLKYEKEKRDREDAGLSAQELKYTLQVWKNMAEERKGSPLEHAHCAIKIHEYESKIRDREQQREDWLANMSAAKSNPGDSGTFGSKQGRSTSSKVTLDLNQKDMRAKPMTRQPRCDESRYRSLAEARSAENTTRAQVGAAEKTKRENAKKADLEAKATAIRAEKELQSRRAAHATRQHADRIANARAKAAPKADPIRAANRSRERATTFSTQDKRVVSKRPKTCPKCGGEHPSLAEWKKCTIVAGKAGESEDGFFVVI